MASTSEQRAFWNEIKRGMMTTTNALQKLDPDDPFTIEVKLIKRPPSSTSSR